MEYDSLAETLLEEKRREYHEKPEQQQRHIYSRLKEVFTRWKAHLIHQFEQQQPDVIPVLLQKHLSAIFIEHCTQNGYCRQDVALAHFMDNPQMPSADSPFMQQYSEAVEAFCQDLDKMYQYAQGNADDYLLWQHEQGTHHHPKYGGAAEILGLDAHEKTTDQKERYLLYEATNRKIRSIRKNLEERLKNASDESASEEDKSET